MHQSISADRDRFLSFAFAAADLLIELDGEGVIRFVAGSHKSLAGLEAEEMIGRPFGDIVDDRDRFLAERCLASLAETPRSSPLFIKFRAASEPVVMRAIHALEDDLDRLTFSLLPAGMPIPSDADIDPATGLMNAESFEQVANRHASDPRQMAHPAELSMVQLIGLAHLASHEDGLTSLLQHLGGIVRAISIDGQSAGRLSDDRFGVIHRAGSAESLGEDLTAALRKHGFEEPVFAVQSVPIGGTQLSQAEACKALSHVMRAFAGKVDGQGSFESLDQALRLSYEDTAKRISDFRQTVEGLRFDIHFQPVVNLETSAITHFEALSRFRDAVTPFEIINFAEDVGITQDFDLAVIRKVLELLETRKQRKRNPTIAINLSTRSLDQDRFVDDLIRMLQGSGSLAKHLSFEITESAEIKDLDRMGKVIARIRKRGHAVALDDFGAGAAAFHYIRALNVDTVKIDGAYTKEILHRSRDASITKAMVEMCQSLSVETIAEMVETQAQCDALQTIGVSHGQGFLFAKPSPDLDLPSPLGNLPKAA